MKRFVEGTDRQQATLFPEYLEDWVNEENAVRVIDVFVDELDLAELGFVGVDPEATGRPSYHPAVLLKLYIYGYLNRVQSSRRLEREAGRNVEVMWLTSRLAPDHKTIADFRRDYGRAIQRVCAQFVALCRTMGLLAEATVAIDGSKFKAVNNRDRNFTRAKMERRMAQIEESVARYLHQLDSADRQEPSEARTTKTTRLREKIAKLKARDASPPGSRSGDAGQAGPADLADRSRLALHGHKRPRLWCCGLQRPGRRRHGAPSDRDARSHQRRDRPVTPGARGQDDESNTRAASLDVVADRGYFNSEEILACERAGITVTLPKPMTSSAKADGRFGKQDFRYVPEDDVYICPAGERLKYRYTREEHGLAIRRYWTNACHTCALKPQCTPAPQRRVSRWEHESILEVVQRRLDEHPEKMRQRRETVEHPFGTIKARMGATHFLMRTLPRVAGEMALHVLAYNLTRVMNIS